MNRTISRAVVLTGLAAAGLWSAPAVGCSTPVYRYALENWDASPYLLVICSNGPLTPEQQALLKDVKTDAESELRPNLETYELDLSKTDDPVCAQLEDALGKKVGEVVDVGNGPQVMVLFPIVYGQGRASVLWSGALDQLDVKGLTNSPVRREAARHLLEGNAVVWLLAESGDAEADAKAEAVLRENLKRLENLIEIEPPDVDPALALDEQAPQETLHPKFACLKFKLGTPEEAFFEKQLRIETLLKDGRKPMAFPLYGRGRVLTALCGDDIQSDWIDQVTAFLTGPCSCQVKSGNPGYDLLMTVDWYAGLANAGELEKALPPLVSPSGIASAAKASTAPTAAVVAPAKGAADVSDPGLATGTEAPDNEGSPVIRNALLAVVGVVVLFALAGLILRTRRAPGT